LEVIPVIKPWFGQKEQDAAAAAIASGWVAQGPRVAAFETALAKRVGAPHGVAVSSCTAGLHLLLHVLELEPGDEVVVPSLSFIATANAPRYVGATPVFADVDRATQNLTADTIQAALTSRTRAVIIVHQVGMPADLDPIYALCAERDIAVIEDAACAIGSSYKGSPIGSNADHVAFSFHPRKLLTTGEGGMIVTARADLAARLRRLREHGMSVGAFERHERAVLTPEAYVETGFNYRMTDIQAAVGLVQLDRLDDMIERRRTLADSYREQLAEVPGLELPDDPPYGTTNYQSFSIVVTHDYPIDRNQLMKEAHEAGISTRRGIMAAHREPSFSDVTAGDLPVTEFLTENSVIVPLFHEMTAADQQRVVSLLRR
jgi:perosamine synthetase